MTTTLVFLETKDGRIKKPSREALSIGRKLGDELIAFASDRAVAEEAGRFGVKRLFVCPLGAYSTEPYTAAIQKAIEQTRPTVVLLGGTSNGRDLAPRLAARLNAGVASDVDRLEWKDGKLRARKPVYAGRAFATVDVSGTPAMATIRPNAFPAEEAVSGAAEVVDGAVTKRDTKA